MFDRGTLGPKEGRNPLDGILATPLNVGICAWVEHCVQSWYGQSMVYCAFGVLLVWPVMIL